MWRKNNHWLFIFSQLALEHISTKTSRKNSERRPHKSGHREWGDLNERFS